MSGKKYRILIDIALGVIVISFEGKIYPKDMFDLLDDLYAEADFDPGFPIVYDFTGSTALGYRLDLIPFLERLRKSRSEKSKPKKIGIILKTLNQRFLADLFVNVADSLSLRVRLFENSLDCIHWITEEPAFRVKLNEMLIQNRQYFVG